MTGECGNVTAYVANLLTYLLTYKPSPWRSTMTSEGSACVIHCHVYVTVGGQNAQYSSSCVPVGGRTEPCGNGVRDIEPDSK